VLFGLEEIELIVYAWKLLKVRFN